MHSNSIGKLEKKRNADSVKNRNKRDIKHVYFQIERTEANAHRVAAFAESSSNSWCHLTASFDSEYNWSFS